MPRMDGPQPAFDADEAGGGLGEPGGTRAMGACEPGQAGNGAAISIAFMRPGAPPRFSQTPSSISSRCAVDLVLFHDLDGA